MANEAPSQITLWARRPLDLRRLFNPAYITIIIASAANAYYAERRQPFPLLLSYVLVPLIAIGSYRNVLPARKTVSLGAWAAHNAADIADLSVACNDLKRIVTEGIAFGESHGAFTIRGQRHIVTPIPFKPINNEISDTIRRSNLVGRWFANAGTVATIYTVLRIEV